MTPRIADTFISCVPLGVLYDCLFFFVTLPYSAGIVVSDSYDEFVLRVNIFCDVFPSKITSTLSLIAPIKDKLNFCFFLFTTTIRNCVYMVCHLINFSEQCKFRKRYNHYHFKTAQVQYLRRIDVRPSFKRPRL